MQRTLWAILVAALILRGAILFTGQRWLRSDEAVVGLMAKHIIARGEMPVFLYGQPYGGGHALVAYLAAPLFSLFGRSAILLTGISATISLVNVWLVWVISRRCIGEQAAPLAAGLYAFSPPVVYQAFLVNGGTETFCMALIALLFFIRAYASEKPRTYNALLAGLFGGLACWSMDYAILYPGAFMLLWLAAGARKNARLLAVHLAGCLIGILPLLLYNLAHDVEHLRYLLTPVSSSVGFVEHFFGAMWGILAGDLAAFFGGDIDDFRPGGLIGWARATAALLATLFLTLRWAREKCRDSTATEIHTQASHKPCVRRVPLRFLPLVFIFLYLLIYGLAKFSLPDLRTPRYLLPLCPFVSMSIAAAAFLAARRASLFTIALAMLLALGGAARSLEIGTRSWHEEHNIRTSGSEIAKLAEFLREHGIRTVFAPYEIQWRLMFQTDESVIVSCRGISPLSRYEAYDREARRRVFEAGESCAFAFRGDFAFAEWAAKGRMGLVTRDKWRAACAEVGLPPDGTPVGTEFVVYYPITPIILERLERALIERTGANHR